MGLTRKQREELKELVYKALEILTSRSPDAYTTYSSVSSLMADLHGSRAWYYQANRVPRILNELYREGKAKRIQIISHTKFSKRGKREGYGYRIST